VFSSFSFSDASTNGLFIISAIKVEAD